MYLHIVVQPNTELFSSYKTETTPIKQLPIPPSHSPWQLPFYFLFLWIWLFYIPDIRGMIQYLSFCDWLISLSIRPSRFIHVVARVRMSSFLRLDNIPLLCIKHIWFIHLSASGHLSCFRILAIVDAAALNTGVRIYLFETLISVLLAICLEMELLDHMVPLFLFFKQLPHSSP